MIVKRLFQIIVLALFSQLCLTSCGGDDNDNLPPGKAVSQLAFRDTDMGKDLIGGTLTWTLPVPETNIEKYVIYLGTTVSDKKDRLGEVLAGVATFEIPAGTAYQPYILVVAANSAGESSTLATLAVEDQTPGQGPQQIPENGIYVLNSGTSGQNNATLDYISFETQLPSLDVFKTRNNRGLGDLANDMIIYGSKIYIAVSSSKTIEITDLKANSLKQVKTEGEPRSLLAYKGSVYATFTNGDFAQLDTAAMSISRTMKVGRNPEQLVVAKDTIYIANSGGMDYNTGAGYDSTVSVVDPAAWKEVRKITVRPNPLNMTTDASGNVYVSSMGDYSTPPIFQRINTSTGTVSVIPNAHATEMASEGGKIYMFYAGYDAKWTPLPVVYGVYDASSNAYTQSQWIKDNIPAKPYKVFTNMDLPHIYFTSGDYSANGDVSVFMSGTFVKKWETSGIYPIKVCFIQEK
ncbi:MAG: hypothetical protein LBH04_01070 [Tannerellaceae bacterium]|jgi:hypothetical protein|nr:hypothetical protein [Tannerellaceae bacterium]